MKRLSILALCTGWLLCGVGLQAQSLDDVVVLQRDELARQLVALRAMAYNFPCKDMAKCTAGTEAKDGERVKAYEAAKQTYQQGLVLLYEGNHAQANGKFNDVTRRIDSLLESLSQTYVDRAGEMLQTAVERRDPKDPTDISLVDLIVEYGPRSRLRENMASDRVVGTKRIYNPKMFRYVMHRSRINASLAMGYRSLGAAKAARQRALSVQKEDPAKGHLPVPQVRERIAHYLAAIQWGRMAKRSAVTVFRLKYPHDIYPLTHPHGKLESARGKSAETATIAGVRMQWGKHPYVLPKRLRAAFDLRVPESFRPDAADLADRVYREELESFVKLGVDPQRAAALKVGGEKTAP